MAKCIIYNFKNYKLFGEKYFKKSESNLKLYL